METFQDLMEGVAVAGGGGPIRTRVDKGRRGWSCREEKVLAEACKKTVREGWKSENGFQTGYLQVLANSMKEVFPTTDIKPEPHIRSRLIVWKKNYHTIFEILSRTGVGLDSSTYMIEATDEQWEIIVKKDPNARLMKHKLWPLYDDWCEIFGVSRAMGEGASDFFNPGIPPNDDNPDVDGDDVSTRVNEENQGESQTPTGGAQSSSEMGKTSSGSKRKSRTNLDPFMTVMQGFCDTATARLGEIVQRIGFEQDISTKRCEIYNSVSAMTMITKQEMLRATALIARSVEDTNVFFSLPEADQVELVLMLLRIEV